jgi:hypothetical protein
MKILYFLLVLQSFALAQQPLWRRASGTEGIAVAAMD